ncbi:WxL domain-containing protein [Enterococcus mundtii]|uniref:WxL domain-containing protein n=1 Tax=Enterococcus mundtii TaxID=53346 RepID=UPI000825655E|nr:WxL domain-containing protein [Enterococcus mundtii]
MGLNLRKQLALLSTSIMLIQVLLSSTGTVYAVQKSIVQQASEELSHERLLEKDYLGNLSQLNESLPEIPEIQQFSFEAQTFSSTVDQAFLLTFTSKLPADHVLLRLPPEGEILEDQLAEGIRLVHSHGDYWHVHTAQEQTTFTLQVAFVTAGAYFITLDHDADHFYVVVEESQIEIAESTVDVVNEEDTVPENESETQESTIEKIAHKEENIIQPISVQEAYHTIPESLISEEEQRILEETRDPQNRSTSNVRNWSQFRSAWNNFRTTEIYQSGNIIFSSSILGDSLNTRNSSIHLSKAPATGGHLGFQDSSTNMEMSGNATLTVTGLYVQRLASSRSNPIISHTGDGLVIIQMCIVDAFSGTQPMISGKNVRLVGSTSVTNTRFANVPAISIRAGGVLDIGYSNAIQGEIVSRNIKPVQLAATSRILIKANRFSMTNYRTNAINSWHQVDVELGGVDGEQVIRGQADPDDFTERYLQTFHNSEYTGLVFNGSGSGWVPPPVIEGTVTVRHVDVYHNELAETETLTGPIGESYVTQPKEIAGWVLNEVPHNTSGVFMKTEQTVTYVYEEEIDSYDPVHPVDPINPDQEVHPENPPELPEEQGALSIDFVSSFDFGQQFISTQDRLYYAKPQRLLNDQGVEATEEERPNYVQISDRRPEHLRNGWQLAVTQSGQFVNPTGNELIGATINLDNQALATAQGGIAPTIQQNERQELIPNTRSVLLKTAGGTGTGTWIYRFGDLETMGESVGLHVPAGVNPETTSYSTKLVWELSSVPDQ